jgi:hypothetical protein
MLQRKLQWVTRVYEGRECVIDEERSGRTATSRIAENMAKFRQIVLENRRLTVRVIAEQAIIDRETVRKILTEDLDMRKVCAKMVPITHRRTMSVRELLANKQITLLEHPLYSPDLTTSDIFQFPKIKEILKGGHFDDTDDIRSNTTAALKAILQDKFQNCFEG